MVISVAGDYESVVRVCGYLDEDEDCIKSLIYLTVFNKRHA